MFSGLIGGVTEESVRIPAAAFPCTRPATAAASELSAEELRRGKVTLEDKVARYSPRWTAFVGIGAYATAFGRRKVLLGLQEETIGGSRVWLLPNTSGLNAHYTPTRFAELLRELRVAACGNDLAGGA